MRSSWHGFDFIPCSWHAHQILAGVGYRGHTGVRDEHAALAVHQPRDYSRAHLESVVLVIAYHRLLYPERVEKLQRHSGVLRGDEIVVFKRIYRAGERGRSDCLSACRQHKSTALIYQSCPFRVVIFTLALVVRVEAFSCIPNIRPRHIY